MPIFRRCEYNNQINADDAVKQLSVINSWTNNGDMLMLNKAFAPFSPSLTELCSGLMLMGTSICSHNALDTFTLWPDNG